MKIDLVNVAYTTGMIILAFVSAIVLTKTIAKYAKKYQKEEEEE